MSIHHRFAGAHDTVEHQLRHAKQEQQAANSALSSRLLSIRDPNGKQLKDEWPGRTTSTATTPKTTRAVPRKAPLPFGGHSIALIDKADQRRHQQAGNESPDQRHVHEVWQVVGRLKDVAEMGSPTPLPQPPRGKSR